MSNAAQADDYVDVPDDVMRKVSEFVEGKLTGAERDDVAAKIASDDRVWKQAHEDVVIVAVTDFVEGKLSASRKSEVEAKVKSDRPEDKLWKQTYEEMTGEDMVEAKKAISGMRLAKPIPPEAFVEHVTEQIQKRSAGRFFARRTLGDRVPFGVLIIVALIALCAVGYFMWSSPTGSLKVQDHKEAPKHKPLDIERP